MTFEMTAVGPQCLVVDLGRVGYASLGVGRSGAFDRAALRRANRLVGNREGDAGLEILVGGVELRSSDAVLVAVTGGRGPVSVEGRPEAGDVAVPVPAGARLTIGPVVTGLRRYVSVRGGIEAPVVLGSRSTDTLSGLGPSPVTARTRLPVGRAHGPVPDAELALAAAFPPDPVVLDATPGPRWDRLTDPAVLTGPTWTVGADCDRIGVRLDGPAIAARDTGGLASEGVRPGSIEITGDGRPLVFGPDAPVTGGYPVAAVLTASAFDLLAQLAPGRAVRIRVARAAGWSDL